MGDSAGHEEEDDVFGFGFLDGLGVEGLEGEIAEAVGGALEELAAGHLLVAIVCCGGLGEDEGYLVRVLVTG